MRIQKKQEKQAEEKVTLFAAIYKVQYEVLRLIAYKENKSLAEIVREAVDAYLQTKKTDLKKYEREGFKALSKNINKHHKEHNLLPPYTP